MRKDNVVWVVASGVYVRLKLALTNGLGTILLWSKAKPHSLIKLFILGSYAFVNALHVRKSRKLAYIHSIVFIKSYLETVPDPRPSLHTDWTNQHISYRT